MGVKLKSSFPGLLRNGQEIFNPELTKHTYSRETNTHAEQREGKTDRLHSNTGQTFSHSDLTTFKDVSLNRINYAVT